MGSVVDLRRPEDQRIVGNRLLWHSGAANGVDPKLSNKVVDISPTQGQLPKLWQLT